MKTINPDIQIFAGIQPATNFFNYNKDFRFLFWANTGTAQNPSISYYVSRHDLRKDWPELYRLMKEK